MNTPLSHGPLTVDSNLKEHNLLELTEYPNPAWFRALRTKALRWFDNEQRQLPWRTRSSPYRIWISEIMLQQTQVQTVIDYFNRFVTRFPTVKKLAEAPESDVLALWEGLGYYRRARNLHAAAKDICKNHAGKFPTRFEDVLNLPGIGRYTAGAILSISLNQHHPILEGNTYRLYARLLALTANPRDREPEKLLWKFATDLLPGRKSMQQPGLLNQALMEIGSEVCKPQNPQCNLCPFRTLCPTHQMELQSSIPKSGKKTVYEDLHQALVIVENPAKKVLVRKSEKGEWWSGLWDFLRVDLNDSVAGFLNGTDSVETLITHQIQKKFGVKALVHDKPFATLKHGVTKYRITLECYRATAKKMRSASTGSRMGFTAKTIDQIHDLPMNITARKAFSKFLKSSSQPGAR